MILAEMFGMTYPFLNTRNDTVIPFGSENEEEDR